MNAEKFKVLRTALTKAYISTPRITEAQIIEEKESGNFLISAQKQIHCPRANSVSKTNVIYEVKDELVIETDNITFESEFLVASRYSKDGTKRAVLKKHSKFDFEKNLTLYVLEIWSQGDLLKNIPLFSEEKGDFVPFIGLVCSHPFLVMRGLEFNGEGDKVIFMAEKFKKKIDVWAKDEEANLTSGNNFKANWGEAAENFSNLGVFVFDLENDNFGELKLEEDKMKVSHAQFLGDKGEKLVFVGYEEQELIQGIGGSTNKLSSVYIVENPEYHVFNGIKEIKKKESFSNLKKISNDPISTLPFPSTIGNRIAYAFCSEITESHLHAFGLKLHDLQTGETTILVKDTDVIYKEGEKREECYLHCKNPKNVKEIPFFVIGQSSSTFKWLSNDDFLLIPSLEYSGTVLNIFDLEDNQRRKFRLSFDFHTDTIKVLDFDNEGNGVLLSLENFYHSSELMYLSNLENYFCHHELRWKDIKEECMNSIQINRSKKENFLKEIYHIDEPNVFEKCVGYEDIKAYLWGIKDMDVPMKDRPVLLLLHGGPHSLRSVLFDPAHNILLKKGFLILNVNYSGTITHGKEFNERIGGRIGELCVSEVMTIIEKLQADGTLTKEKLHFEGGSYSGYLGFMFLKKYPDMFKSMIIRNPVVNLLHIQYSTDIPSWAHREALGKENKFDFSEDLSDKEVLKLAEKSPGLGEFKKSKTKMRVFLGKKDKRVPMKAMFYLSKKLKEIGIDLKVSLFESCGHGIRIRHTEEVFEMKVTQLVNCSEDFIGGK